MWGGFSSLESNMFDDTDNRKIDFLSEKSKGHDFCKNISSYTSKNPSCDNVTRIMDSPNYPCHSSQEPDSNSNYYDDWISSKCKKSDDTSSGEERMAWWKWIISWMIDKWLYSFDDGLRVGTKCMKSKIDNTVDHKRENNRRKYHKCGNLIAIIVLFESEEPESHEKSSWPKDNRFSCYLYEKSIVFGKEISCPDEEFSIETKEGFNHVAYSRREGDFPKGISILIIDI